MNTFIYLYEFLRGGVRSRLGGLAHLSGPARFHVGGPGSGCRVGRGLISVFQEFFAGIDKASDFEGGMGTRLSFYGV